MRNTTRTAALAGAAALALGACLQSSGLDPDPTGGPPDEPEPEPVVVEPKEIEIDLDAALAVELPEIAKHLEPAAFRTPDGREGWAIRIPGNRPIATPAYEDGLLFVGGGYGSHEFYAFDAETGAVVWQIKTSDDGPTAAVVEDGLVAFNTESCTVVVVEAKTGKLVWQEWLGDPLMSQPAIHAGKLYMAYPAGQRAGQNRATEPEPAAGNQKLPPTGHRLLCADLKTGKHIWEAAITGDVISAPVIDEDRVYFTCFDGTSFCLEATDGKQVWRKENAGTSAPIVAGGQVLLTVRDKDGDGVTEGIRRLSRQGEAVSRQLEAVGDATHLDRSRGGGVAITEGKVAELETSVGFGGGAPGAASMDSAGANVGVYSVVGAWAYQGSRAAFARGSAFNGQGLALNSVSESGMNWRASVRGEGFGKGVQAFSPPALGLRENLYLASARGHLLSVRQSDGAVGFSYAFGRPIVFQPALARGNVYAGTVDGLLLCLKTGDPDADDWSMWGGDARHNKSR